MTEERTAASYGRQPLRVVFDSQARLPVGSKLLATLDQSPVLVVAAPGADPTRLDALRAAGAETLLAAGATPAERIASALADLGRRGLTSLFLEGGRTLAAAFLAAAQIDESRTFIAPMLLGTAKSAAAEAPRLTALHSRVEAVGEDTLITARYKEW